MFETKFQSKMCYKITMLLRLLLLLLTSSLIWTNLFCVQLITARHATHDISISICFFDELNLFHTDFPFAGIRYCWFSFLVSHSKRRCHCFNLFFFILRNFFSVFFALFTFNRMHCRVNFFSFVYEFKSEPII